MVDGVQTPNSPILSRLEYDRLKDNFHPFLKAKDENTLEKLFMKVH